MSQPLVSVIVPVFNGAAFVERSVLSVLSQTYSEVEAVIVDDGSLDGSADVAEAMARHDDRVIVVRKPRNMGLAAARNTGIEIARGEYIGFLDVDDWLFADKVQRQVAVLENNPHAGLAYSDHLEVSDDDGSTRDVVRGPAPVPFHELLVYRNWFAPMSALLRRSLIAEVGEFDTSFRAAEDWDYWYRCARASTFLYVPGVLAAYRLHSGQMHRDHDLMRSSHQQFVAKHFAGDPRRSRSSIASARLYHAKRQWSIGDRIGCFHHLVGFLRSANSVAEMQLVWRISR